MTKKITLPLVFKKFAENYAQMTCELNGIKEGERGYKKEYEKAFNKFCEEAYLHSLSPLGATGGHLKSNPTTKKVSGHVVEDFELFKQNGFIKGLGRFNLSKDEERLLINHVKGSVMSLTNFIMVTCLGLNTSSNASIKSDFEYPAQDGDIEFAKLHKDYEKMNNKEALKMGTIMRVEVSRYYRYAVFAHITAMVTKYMKNLTNVHGSLSKRIQNQFPNATDHSAKGLRLDDAMMTKKVNRKKFTTRCYDDVINNIINPLE